MTMITPAEQVDLTVALPAVEHHPRAYTVACGETYVEVTKVFPHDYWHVADSHGYSLQGPFDTPDEAGHWAARHVRHLEAQRLAEQATRDLLTATDELGSN